MGTSYVLGQKNLGASVFTYEHLLRWPKQKCLRKVCTSFGLVLSLYYYGMWVSIMRISHFLMPVGYGYTTVFVFLIPFGSIQHATSFICR